jgi:hypothetical protein
VEPGRDDPALATNLLLAGADTDETFRAAVSTVARLARAAFGPELEPGEVLQRLGMVDDAGLARLARLWVDLALTAGRPGDPAGPVADLAARVSQEGVPGRSWLSHTGSLLSVQATEVAGKGAGRLAEPLEQVRRHAEGLDPDPAPALRACVALARFARSRGGIGPGAWLSTPTSAAAQAVGAALAEGQDRDTVLDLLAQLLQDDVEGPDLLEAFICAFSQFLVHLEPHEEASTRQVQVAELMAAVPGGPRGARWLMAACLREAHEHDSSAVDLGPFLSGEPGGDPDRAAARLGRVPLLAAGVTCLEGLAAVLGEAAQMPREELLGFVLPSALGEHDLLR